MSNRFRILISNDDGVDAPGLRCLIRALLEDDAYDVLVCGPASEQSARSHAITLGRELAVYPIDVPGAVEAFAVEGTPADSVMLAVSGPVFRDPRIDLVLSGINRGENCGWHVLYSGTVGAAREAVLKGVPAIALSSDCYHGNTVEHFEVAARAALPLIKGVLGQLPGCHALHHRLGDHLLNVNFPDVASLDAVRGYVVAHQGRSCVMPNFQLSDPKDVESAEPNEAGRPGVRHFRNCKGPWQVDEGEGTSDKNALAAQLVAVTLLGMQCDVPTTCPPGREELVTAVADLVSTLNASHRTG